MKDEIPRKTHDLMKSVDKDKFRRNGVNCKVVMVIMTNTKGFVEGRGGKKEMEEKKKIELKWE